MGRTFLNDSREIAKFTTGTVGSSPLRAAIRAAHRRAETECVGPLIAEASLPADALERARRVAQDLVEGLRASDSRSGVAALMQEYSLSSAEGVALMCLAEALLRIPDDATRDALIRDKIAPGDWRSHLGHSDSLFVNAATWGLALTGKLASATGEQSLSAVLTRLIARGGEALIRKSVDLAMRMLGEQFVAGRTIKDALANGAALEQRGFRHSYDMLGEAALTAADAARYFDQYESAIHAIGAAAGGRGIYDGPGISIKLSALHPRYARSQRSRVMAELLPRVVRLAALARRYDIGLNNDAEEADRLELSLDILEALCFDTALADWNGVGFVVQAYQKRCPFVIDFLIDLARRSRRRLMLRLVKGAYWDSEIKRAQQDGLVDYPVFTRKIHTDVCYLACARKLLAAPDAVYPQFATHNAHTLATVMQMAGEDYQAGQYEFQCLHGMGEPLYAQVVGFEGLNRPCRIYAPVGTHETLLAYLVRRLLENGANSSFVNRVGDPDVSIDELLADPVATAGALKPVGAPHLKIPRPRELFGNSRANSTGVDLTCDVRLAALTASFAAGAGMRWRAAPMVGERAFDGPARQVLNPADHHDVVGDVVDATPQAVAAAFERAIAAAPAWAQTVPAERAACLSSAADAMEARMDDLLGLIIREAGKTAANAVAEVREAVDFLRYYAVEIRSWPAHDAPSALGPVVCISPWNFPLAIFTGQVAAALAAGNSVLAKPAEETPLIAAEAVCLLRGAGVPGDALQFLPGDGTIGAALVADPRVSAVMFTGSMAVAREIRSRIAGRLSPDGRTLPLIAETGGINAMVVDSSALAEQVVTDVVASAFDSAGQRCSALRILCVQEEIAGPVLAMLDGALAELSIGDPGILSTDVGPVINAQACRAINAHVDAMAARGHRVARCALPDHARRGTFVAPAVIAIDRITDVVQEVFGPVLHVLRYRRDELDDVIGAINALGYGLTFGMHSRIDDAIARVTARIQAGNIYVNRNIIGATVGVQPFGGCGLSGTGPKAGGPLMLRRLVRAAAPNVSNVIIRAESADAVLGPVRDYCVWLRSRGLDIAAKRCENYMERSSLGTALDLSGPVGERNTYCLQARGRIAVLPSTLLGLYVQIGAALATGNEVVLEVGAVGRDSLASLPQSVAARIAIVADWTMATPLAAVLFEGDAQSLRAVDKRAAGLDGALVAVHALRADELARGVPDYPLEWLLEERSVCTNTAAAGGNASLMAIA